MPLEKKLPITNTYMENTAWFTPGQMEKSDNERDATQEERETFGEIFEIAKNYIRDQKGVSLNSIEVKHIEVNYSADFTDKEKPERKFCISIFLSDTAPEKLETTRDQENRYVNTKHPVNARSGRNITIASILPAGGSFFATAFGLKNRFKVASYNALSKKQIFAIGAGSFSIAVISYFALRCLLNRLFPGSTDKHYKG